MTHYDLPKNYIASCGCVGASTLYPTAALNQLAFGSSTSFGPGCGQCFRVTLTSTPTAPPPPDGDGKVFAPGDAAAPSIVIKATDLCPATKSNSDWCSQTTNPDKPNSLGSMVHFDLAFPSVGIPNDFFPRNSQGGDYGVWRVNYTQVSCTEWAGWSEPSAWGSQWAQQDNACCPPNPTSAQAASKAVVNDPVLHARAPLNGANISLAAQTAMCPSYSRLAASVPKDSSLSMELLANVPNTSNLLTKKKGDTSAEDAANVGSQLSSQWHILASSLVLALLFCLFLQ